jgi:hypothetical protein
LEARSGLRTRAQRGAAPRSVARRLLLVGCWTAKRPSPRQPDPPSGSRRAGFRRRTVSDCPPRWLRPRERCGASSATSKKIR